jgi:nuclear GTP-binding protein
MKTPKAWSEILNAIEKQATIILEILDARDPEGTRPHEIEEHIEQRCAGKKLFLILNKADLVPEDVMHAWVKYYQDLGFTCFYASALRKDWITFLMSQIVRYIDHNVVNKILVVGYPNTGKSSIITALLKEKKHARISSEAGFTRGLQLLKIEGWHNMYLLDSPGVVPIDEEDAELNLALKAAIKVSKIDDPQAVFEEIYRRATPEKLKELYEVEFSNSDEFTQALGRKRGRLKKGNEVNEPEVWMIVIRDWQRNFIPFYTIPPNYQQPEK